jgi:hypothetical protein
MLASHGRGGAGNMADLATTEKTDPSKLQTPVLKGSVVTTGRGGTGNMAKNDDPRETRKRQDVEAYVPFPLDPSPPGGLSLHLNSFTDFRQQCAPTSFLRYSALGSRWRWQCLQGQGCATYTQSQQ